MPPAAAFFGVSNSPYSAISCSFREGWLYPYLLIFSMYLAISTILMYLRVRAINVILRSEASALLKERRCFFPRHGDDELFHFHIVVGVEIRVKCLFSPESCRLPALRTTARRGPTRELPFSERPTLMLSSVILEHNYNVRYL